MDLFSTQLETISFTDIENFLAISYPEEERPSEGMKIDYKLKVIPSRSADQAPGNAEPALIKAIGRAHEWVRLIFAGEYKDQRAIAAATGLNERYVSRVIQSAFLAPEIVEAIVRGRQAPEMTLASLLDEVPLSWAEQNVKIGVVFER